MAGDDEHTEARISMKTNKKKSPTRIFPVLPGYPDMGVRVHALPNLNWAATDLTPRNAQSQMTMVFYN
jgi:hypothetical protein